MRTLLFTARFYGIQLFVGLVCFFYGLYGAYEYTPLPSSSAFATPDYGTIFYLIAGVGFCFVVYALKKGASEKMY
ncbi:MAG: hypothetical protein ACTS9Y_00295 [Methylophilus sp.]|uniref:hypothetical protein n=1 Tax=Methylophilus sp. TaxID=29541 RepID=UPI003FA0A58C